MKKIQFLTTSNYPNTVGGLEIFNYYLAKNLKKYFDVSSIGYDSIEEVKWIKLYKFKPQTIFYPLQFFWNLLVNRNYVDIVVISYSEAKPIIWYLLAISCKVMNKSYIVINHWGVKPKWKVIFPYKYLFDNSAFNIGISEQICKDYSIFTKNKFKYFAPLIPFEKCITGQEKLKKKYGLPNESNVLIYVGSLKKMKNPDKILSMFINNIEYFKKNNYYLVFTGTGDLMSTMRVITAKYELESRVIFTGVILREYINEVYCLGDIYLIASDYEGTPLSMLEAMFNKMPIVASNVPGINKIISHNNSGLLFEVNNEKEMFTCVQRLIEERELASTLSKNAFDYFQKNFDYTSILKIYTEILDGLHK